MLSSLPSVPYHQLTTGLVYLNLTSAQFEFRVRNDHEVAQDIPHT